MLRFLCHDVWKEIPEIARIALSDIKLLKLPNFSRALAENQAYDLIRETFKEMM